MQQRALRIDNQASIVPEVGIDYKTSTLAQKLADLPIEQFEQAREGAMTVAKACAAVVRECNAKLKDNAAPTPEGRFDCIVIADLGLTRERQASDRAEERCERCLDQDRLKSDPRVAAP